MAEVATPTDDATPPEEEQMNIVRTNEPLNPDSVIEMEITEEKTYKKPKCLVPTCDSIELSKVNSAPLPKTGRRKSWLLAIGLKTNWYIRPNARICFKHFKDEDLTYRGRNGRKRLNMTVKPKAWPKLHLGRPDNLLIPLPPTVQGKYL